MAKSNIRHDNTREEKVSKNRIRWIDTYADPLLMREVAVSTSTLERLAEDIVQWALTDLDAIYVTEFFVTKGITPVRWRDWRKKCPELEHAYVLAKEIIGVRQFKGVTKGKLRDNFLKSHIGFYSDEWREESKRVSENAQPSGSGISVVEVPVFPKTDVVPELRE
jgi:hypothetical protein